jgi:hypothetical protein
MTLDAARPAPRSPEVRPSVEHLLDAQAGLLTREQALAAGGAAEGIVERVRTRRWRPLHPRGYLVRAASPGPLVEARAALLRAGAGAVLSGPVAAWWHGLLAGTAEPPAVHDVTVPPPAGRRARPRAGLRVHCRELAPVDVTVVQGLPVTALARTVLDAAVLLGPEGAALVDRALADRVRFTELIDAHRRMAGAPGAGRAAVVLESAISRQLAARTGARR